MTPPPAVQMKSSDPGPKPDLKWIPTKELYIDHQYQRGTQSKASQRNLKYLVDEFSWAHCGTLIVVQVEKQRYAVIDGQHRLAAAKKRCIPEMPCVIVRDSDFKKQAQSFSIINSKRVKLHPMAQFHAAAADGDPDAVALKSLLKDCNIQIPKVPVAKGDTWPRETQAIGTLLAMLGKYSVNQISWALKIIPEAYGEERGQMRSSLIKALAEFAKNNLAADKTKMAEVLRDLDPSDLEKDAQSYVAIKGGTTTAAIVMALDRLYKTTARKAVRSAA
jgi:hypothetical protein